MQSYSISKNKLNNLFTTYLFATLLVLIPACANPKGISASIGFFFASLLILFIYKDLKCLAMYYIIILINSSLATMRVVGMELTITSFIYVYMIFMLIVSLIKRKKEKIFYISIPLMIIWMIYLVFNNVLYGFGVFNAIWYCAPLFLSILMCKIVTSREKYMVHFMTCVVVAFFVVIITGYIELLIGKTFFYSLWKTNPFYRFGILRVGSTLADPNFMCLIDVCMIFIIRSVVFQRIFGRRLMKILEILAVVQVVASMSRTGIIALMACYVIELLCKKKTWMLALSLILLIAASVLPTILEFILNIDANSTGSRFRVIEVAMQLWRTNPIVGLGNNSFSNASFSLLGTQINTMNVYIEQLVNYGLIGVTFYILYIIMILRHPLKNVISKNHYIDISAKLVALVCGWLIISFTLDTFSKVLIWIIPAIELTLYYYADHNNI